MATHDLKTWPKDFYAVMFGSKTHEARKDDRGFELADTLLLREWDPATGEYTGRSVEALVTHITKGEYGLPADLAIMSILRLTHTALP